MFSLLANYWCWLKHWREPVRKVTLLMVGLDNAGKTATIKGIQGEPPYFPDPTVGFSRVDIKQGKFEVTIYDLGGGRNIRSIWKNYYAESFGVIFVVDSSDIIRMEIVKEAVTDVIRHPGISGKPVLVLANKQDCVGALGEAELIERLSLEKLVNENKSCCKIQPCSALWGYGKTLDKAIKKGLNWLLVTIAKDYDNLQERVERDTMVQKAREDQEKRERAERVRKIQEERELKEREDAKRDGHLLNQDDSDEPDPQTNPFQPLPKVTSVNEEEIEGQKEKNNRIPNGDPPLNIAEQGPSKMEKSTGDTVPNDQPLKLGATAEAVTDKLQVPGSHQKMQDSVTGRKKFKKFRMKRKNIVEPGNVGDASGNLRVHRLPDTSQPADHLLLQERVERDTMVQKAWEDQEKRERAERVRKIQEERELKEREDAKRDGHLLNQDDSDEPDPQTNPFQPLPKVTSVNEEEIEGQKEKNKEIPNGEPPLNIAEQGPSKMEKSTGDTVPNDQPLKLGATAEAVTDKLQVPGSHQEMQDSVTGKKKFKKFRMKTKNIVEPGNVSDASGNLRVHRLPDFYTKPLPPVPTIQEADSEADDV
ncbi:ADP-ribosylation factor-like protein 13B [Mobula birostris]|uniref:ADP-ribosylation factor-like protein 13B n=1 Tax=Mobula birostris TaxID=1983395 RepID=UPI003B27B9CF